MNNRPRLPHPHPDRRVPALGQVAYDPASGRTGVVQAVYSAAELCFDHRMTGSRVAFLRPARGGVEWLADASTLRSPVAEERAT
ncbi:MULTISPECIES: hypothetical protein [unclassified Streptomyces]|uniref:hypothetical protein n=1 Tax=unclassified Streptomyces TaxID=2593676 RepID=UPI00336ADAE0